MLAMDKVFGYYLRWMSRFRHFIPAATVLLLLQFPGADLGHAVVPEQGVISGRAVDVDDSEGVGGVIVRAFGSDRSGKTVCLATTVTAPDGTYKISLPDGSYLVRAECDGCLNGDERSVVYYPDQFDPLRGEAISVISGQDVADIDFGLNPLIPGGHYIAGHITDESSGEGLPDVIVTARDYVSGVAVNSSLSADDGEFRVGNLPSGDYLLFFSGYHIIPYFRRATEFWQSAEVIHLGVSIDDIQSDAITQDYGNLLLAITGRVETGSRAVGAARVYAYLVGEERPRAFAASDDTGEYAITVGLVPGYYRVVCDLFGFDAQVYRDTVYLDLLEHPLAENVDFLLAPHTTGTRDDAELPEKTSIFQNYPNPFNARTTIPVYSTYEGIKDAEISVYDILGRRVGRKQFVVNPGMNYINWGLDDFHEETASGIFFYRMSGQGKSYRMIILK